MKLFRELDESEKQSFIDWAKANATPENFAKAEIMHPLVRQTWLEMGVITDATSEYDTKELDFEKELEHILNAPPGQL